MSKSVKVRRIGNSLGIVLPKETLATLKVEEGDNLYVTEGAQNSIRVTADEPSFARQMEIVERGMRKYRNALRELAK